MALLVPGQSVVVNYVLKCLAEQKQCDERLFNCRTLFEWKQIGVFAVVEMDLYFSFGISCLWLMQRMPSTTL